ncbi:MAG: glycosyltransferase [Actinomycetota bacterium]
MESQSHDESWREPVAVVIPARLEVTRIDRCLDGVLASTTDRRLDVLVVCNGPADDTEQRVADREVDFVARGWTLTVERIDDHGKCASIRRGALRAAPGPLVVLDVRVGLRPDTLERLVAGAIDRALYYASARLDYVVEGDAVCRAFSRAYAASPFGRSHDLKGTCVFVAHERRADLLVLPDVPAEDRYYLSLTPRDRRGTISDSVVEYHFPTTARRLFDQQMRWASANRATVPVMDRHDRPDHVTDRRPYFGARPPRLADRVVYGLLSGAARVVARTRPMKIASW